MESPNFEKLNNKPSGNAIRKVLAEEKDLRVRRFFGDAELVEGIPKARILAGLPYGNLGDTAIVCKGKVNGIDEPVAVKMARATDKFIADVFEEELEKSKTLSEILPNVAYYYNMIEVEKYEQFPAFCMEIVRGYPILDRNLECIGSDKLKSLVKKDAVARLGEALKTAASHGWKTDDLQYFVLLEDQELNGRRYEKGELILFDFFNWIITTDRTRSGFEESIERITKMIDGG